MTTANILCFLAGSLTATGAAFFYLLHVERMNRNLIAAVRQKERREAYAEGWRDAVMPPPPTTVLSRPPGSACISPRPGQ